MAHFTIDVTFLNGNLAFSGNCDGNGGVDVDWLGDDARSIAFRLHGGAGDRWAGIRISRHWERVLQAPTALDTQGQFYGRSCFKVGPTTEALTFPTLKLTGHNLAQVGGVWFYCVGIKHFDNSESWPASKIERSVAESRALPPGLYFGGQDKTKRSRVRKRKLVPRFTPIPMEE